MCQVAAPPAPFVAGPLQAPGIWLLIAGMLVVLTVAVVLQDRRYLRPLSPSVGRKVGLAFLVCIALALQTGMVIVGLVVLPTLDALSKWSLAQEHALDAHSCPASAQHSFLAAWQRAQNGGIVPWLFVGLVLLWVGGSAQLLWLLGMAWLAHRTRALPARQ
jgi:hypothetical protein